MKETAKTVNTSSHPHMQTHSAFESHSSAISLTPTHTVTTLAVEYKPQVPPHPTPEHIQILLFKTLKSPWS